MDNASEKNKASAEKVALKKAPRQFFMTLRDISFWIRSAKADNRLSILTKLTVIHEIKS